MNSEMLSIGSLFILVSSNLAFADTFSCPVTSIIPLDPSTKSAALKIETRMLDFYNGSVVSVDLEKNLKDDSLVTQRVYGYGPWIRGVPISDVFFCNPAIETNAYNPHSGRIRLMSMCRVSSGSLDFVDLDSTLHIDQAGTFKYSYPESGESKSVEIVVDLCTKL